MTHSVYRKQGKWLSPLAKLARTPMVIIYYCMISMVVVLNGRPQFARVEYP